MNKKLTLGLVGSLVLATPTMALIGELYKITQQPEMKEAYNNAITECLDTIHELKEDETTSIINLDIFEDVIVSWEDSKTIIFEKLEEHYGE